MKPKVFHQKITCKEFSKSSAFFQILFQICFPKNKTRNLIHRNENWRLSWCAFQREFSGKYNKNLYFCKWFPIKDRRFVHQFINLRLFTISIHQHTPSIGPKFPIFRKKYSWFQKKKCLKNRFLKCMWFHNFKEWLMISPIDKCQWNFVPKQIIHSH